MVLGVRRIFGPLYAQVLVAVAVGAALGRFYPHWALAMHPLGDGFIKLIRMLVAPIVFTTVVTGIAQMRDLARVGRVGLKAIVYFEVITTLALAIGLTVGRCVAPGSGMHVNLVALDAHEAETYASAGKQLTVTEFLLGIIPSTFGEAFARGEVLPVLLLAIGFGCAAALLGERVEKAVELFEEIGQVLFRMVGFVMHLAPIGAFGAIAFTVGKYGLGTLVGLGGLVASFYVTVILFVLLILGAVGRFVGFNIVSLVRYLRDEIFIVVATSSSESVLPRLMEKLEALGCDRSIVGVTVPMGYSFNLDGTSIYLTLATTFIAQALDIKLAASDELGLLAILLVTSKGAAAVTGGGFVTLAATLSATGTLPVAGLALLLGVDRFMSEARALTNLIGNAVATVVVSRWEGGLDRERLAQVLAEPHMFAVASRAAGSEPPRRWSSHPAPPIADADPPSTE
jgi:aerobic C4-dicarboxylate transport protein